MIVMDAMDAMYCDVYETYAGGNTCSSFVRRRHVSLHEVLLVFESFLAIIVIVLIIFIILLHCRVLLHDLVGRLFVLLL